MLNLKYKRKHRTFDYKTRFYDAEKEALNERLARYEQDGKDKTVENSKDNIRGSFKSYSPTPTDRALRSKFVNQSNIRLIIIIAVLCFVLYMVLVSDQVLSIIDGM